MPEKEITEEDLDPSLRQDIKEEDKKVKEAFKQTLGAEPEEINAMVAMAQQMADALNQMVAQLNEIKYFSWTLLQTFYVNEKGVIRLKTISELLITFGLNPVISQWIEEKNKLLNTAMANEDIAKEIIEGLDDFIADAMTHNKEG